MLTNDEYDGTETMDESTEMQVTCNRCSYSGSIRAVQVHSCYVQEQGGRCEDYPCCGHTDGDGCQTLPEHTSDYWMEKFRDADYFDRYMNGEFD